MNEIHNKYNKFNHTNGTVKCFTLMNSWWYTQNAPTKIKQVAYLPIVGIMLIMNVSKLTAVWNWSSGNSIPKINKVITIPKIPSQSAIILPGSIFISL